MKNERGRRFAVNKRLLLALSLSAIILLGGILAVFLFLYVKVSGGFIAMHAKAITVAGMVIISVFTACAVIFAVRDNKFVFRLTAFIMSLAVFVLIGLYVLNITGFWYKITSVEDLREYIKSFGVAAWLVVVIIQFLQVAFLPVPGVIVTGAAVASFGPFQGAVLSFIGIYIGSVTAFFIGRKFGYKAAAWLVGESSIIKVQKYFEGKDKLMFTVMFLLPFFPDDVLCFVAGLSTVSVKFFLLSVFFTRLISVFLTSYSISGNLIPYDQWWGIVLWALIIIAAVTFSALICKKNGMLRNKPHKKLVNFFGRGKK